MFMSLVSDLLTQALTINGIDADTLHIDVPSDAQFGDYSANVALLHAKNLKMNPMELAQKIIDSIPANDTIEKAQAIKPGFINIFLKSSLLLQVLGNASSKSEVGTSDLDGKAFTVEFTDPNPFKEFHIGHLYSNTAGEAISRLLEAAGVKVRRVNYQGDVGVHVACSVWGMFQKTLNSPTRTDTTELSKIEQVPLAERVKWLGQCYAQGATAYKEDEKAKDEIKSLNAQIFMAAQTMWKRERPEFEPKVDYTKLVAREIFPQSSVQEYYEKGRRWTLDYFDTIYKRLGTTYASAGDYYFESYIGELGYDLVHKHLTDGVFEKSDGAIVFKGEKYGFHTRVFINSLGLPTYEAKEIGLNPTKFKDVPFDTSLIVTANEIEEYFKVVLKAMSLVAPEVASKTKHIAHGVVKLPEGKMSSRTGKIISGESLLNEVRDKLYAKVAESKRLAKEDLEVTVERLAVAAIKYSFLRSSLGKDVVFNFEESLSFEGNSGPYLLYSIVRCKSILEKAKDSPTTNQKTHAQPEDLDIGILRLLIHFPDVVTQAATLYSPHLLCTYLHKLAQEFNAYYDKAPILKAEGDLRTLRLAIVERVRSTLSAGVQILGFQEVERM
ncbi:arginine--tRNA ligase [Candidatus Woesebacteria bacterium]|nr:arginine--tRNA ligase [Candidatus Woesebacteria bacterium]